jgi:hypothetical protein
MNIEIDITDRVTLPDGFSTVAIGVPALRVHEVLDMSFDVLHEAFGEPDPLALDLLLIGGIAYVLDKAVPRRVAEDFWTRDFAVEFPVSDPRRWARATQHLERCLTFLTGDEWSVGFRSRPERLFTPTRVKRDPVPAIPARAVSLFSGGADSLIGTLDLLVGDPSVKVLLLGHHDATFPAGDQRRLWALLDGTSYRGRTDLRRVRVRPLLPKWARPGQRVEPAREGREPTLRARSFVFLTLGLYAARALGDRTQLLVPENGFIAINIPLTPSRVGTCSTRTTHPYYLDAVRTLIGTVGFENVVDNPLEGKTKGEALQDCRDQATLVCLARQSVSCAHPSRRAIWRRRSARNCGYCVPCLIRRAAFHRVGQDDGADYGLDACAGELDSEANVAADFRAVLDCLDQVRSRKDVEERVLMTGPLGGKFGASVDLVRRGLGELRALMTDKRDAAIRGTAGIR